VRDVEDADPLADGLVLLQHTTAGVLDRHLPAAEVGELGTEGDVAFVDRRGKESHGRSTYPGRHR
jgi:hypothetical protein